MEKYWEEKDWQDLDKAEKVSDLFVVAKRIIERMPKPVVQVCGPISTGGAGSTEENLNSLKQKIRELEAKRLNVFDQTIFDPAVQKIKGKLKEGQYFEDIITDFHQPIFENGLIQKLYFMPNWQFSHGTKWEHDQAEKLGIEIAYL